CTLCAHLHPPPTSPLFPYTTLFRSKPIEPHHGLVAGISMIVKGPRWSDDEITHVHEHLFAIDGRVGTRAMQDEAKRRLRMTMSGRDFAGQDQLKPRIKTVRDARLATQAWVFEHQHAALGFLRRNQGAGFKQPFI